jgi:hypothetical protein
MAHKEWNVGDYVCFYTHRRRRHGLIRRREWGPDYHGYRYDILNLAYYSPYFSSRWQLITSPYVSYSIEQKHLLSKLRAQTAVKYKLMGVGSE